MTNKINRNDYFKFEQYHLYLGEGATARCYKLMDDHSKAVKFFQASEEENNVTQEEVQNVFHRTIQVLTSLEKSPYFPNIYDCDENELYCIMDTAKGEDLSTLCSFTPFNEKWEESFKQAYLDSYHAGWLMVDATKLEDIFWDEENQKLTFVDVGFYEPVNNQQLESIDSVIEEKYKEFKQFYLEEFEVYQEND